MLLVNSVIPGKETTPGGAAERDELAVHVRQALVELESQQAEVFCLACLEDMDYRDIAEILGLSVSHVGVLLHRAKARLRERMDVYTPSPTTPPAGKEILP